MTEVWEEIENLNHKRGDRSDRGYECDVVHCAQEYIVSDYAESLNVLAASNSQSAPLYKAIANRISSGDTVLQRLNP